MRIEAEDILKSEKSDEKSDKVSAKDSSDD